jgi:hypothetical protein
MVSTLNHLGKRPFSKHFHYFIPISYLLADFHPEVPFKIIKNWVALKLAIRGVFHFLLFSVKSLDSLLIYQF